MLRKSPSTRKGGPHHEDTNRPRMPTSNLGEGLRIRNEGAIKRADIALRHAAMRETAGILQMRRNGRAAQGWRDRPDPRNCPRCLRGSTRTETNQEDPLIEMDGENFRSPQKTEGQPATSTRDRVPALVDPRHDRREGAPLRPGMANCDYTNCTQRLDGVNISKRTRCHHLVVTAPLGDMAIEEQSSNPPPPHPRRRHTRRPVQIWSRRTKSKPLSKDGLTLSTKTSTSSLPRMNVP